MWVPWELNPQPFALLMHCSTTEPQKPPLASSETTYNIISVLAIGSLYVYFKVTCDHIRKHLSSSDYWICVGES